MECSVRCTMPGTYNDGSYATCVNCPKGMTSNPGTAGASSCFYSGVPLGGICEAAGQTVYPSVKSSSTRLFCDCMLATCKLRCAVQRIKPWRSVRQVLQWQWIWWWYFCDTGVNACKPAESATYNMCNTATSMQVPALRRCNQLHMAPFPTKMNGYDMVNTVDSHRESISAVPKGFPLL